VLDLYKKSQVFTAIENGLKAGSIVQ